MKYILLPFVAWAVSGSLKFLVNEIRYGAGKKLIGYGGLPSTHTTIISSAVFALGFSRGFETPEFSLGLSVLLLFVMDAHGLRRKIGSHAEVLNRLQRKTILRERMGHSWLEIFCGLVLGAALGYIFS
ncbi:MAG: divergent PAP2 family protein [Selenomonadaceae bacterium]|nr:divergent PAP2 family protein [Selenomonadaceae bacterium]